MYPTAPIHVPDHIRAWVQATLDRLSYNELVTFWQHLTERSGNHGPVLGGPVVPSEVYTDAQLADDAAAIAAGPLMIAALQGLGWTEP